VQDVSAAAVYLGVDAHKEHCTFCAIDKRGKVLMRKNIPTNTKQLRAAARELPERTWAMIEASSVSIFVQEALASVLDRVIICETRENRLISKSQDKSDEKDAERLARLLRMGEFKDVHVPARSRQEIRELVRVYQNVVGDVVRVKNRINNKYARYGVQITDSAYGDGRHDALKQLNRLGLKTVFDAMYTVLDAAEKSKDDLDHALRARLSHTREYKLLKTIPGVGPVCAAIMVAVIDQPDRFPNKRHLWSYAGVGTSEESTGKTPVKVKGMKHYNRLLKFAAMMAAQNAIRGDNRFARHYKAMVEANTDPKKAKKAAAMAKKVIARAILSAALAMWKTGTAYTENSLAKSA